MEAWAYIGFIVIVLTLLAIDLGVLNRKSHVISAREALKWTAMFVSLALSFAIAIYFIYENNWLGIGADVPQASGEKIDVSGLQAVKEYLTGYLVEYSLSLDNIFVIAVIFGFFRIPAQHQHRLLFWGILGALVMRGVMIGLGAALLESFHWIIYVFGVILLWTAYKMAFSGDAEFDPSKSRVLRLVARMVPVSNQFDGSRFFSRRVAPIDARVAIAEMKSHAHSPVEDPEPGRARDSHAPTHAPTGAAAADAPVDVSLKPENTGAGVGKLIATPMFLALIVVEVTDVLFAVDSIPAIFGITRDPFIVFTSNVFAILGLRSLFFALSAMLRAFHLIKYALAFVLAFVGVKMLLTIKPLDVHVPAWVSLTVIVVSLALGIVVSLLRRPSATTEERAHLADAVHADAPSEPGRSERPS
ncbi:MAG: TerC family protein [Planctomycetota bacterium]|nr:TerC family protein [Planctomycetota bacterium]